MEYAVATDADLPAMDDGVDAFWSAMASLKTVAGHYKYSTISIQFNSVYFQHTLTFHTISTTSTLCAGKEAD